MRELLPDFSETMSFNLAAGEFDLDPTDKSKDSAVLFPAALLIIDKQGRLQLDLNQNAWKLIDALDRPGTRASTKAVCWRFRTLPSQSQEECLTAFTANLAAAALAFRALPTSGDAYEQKRSLWVHLLAGPFYQLLSQGNGPDVQHRR